MRNEKKPLGRQSSFYGAAQMFAPLPSQTKRKRLPSELAQPPSFKKFHIELVTSLVPEGEPQEKPSSPASGSEGSLFPIASKKESKESIFPSGQNENLPPSPGKH